MNTTIEEFEIISLTQKELADIYNNGNKERFHSFRYFFYEDIFPTILQTSSYNPETFFTAIFKKKDRHRKNIIGLAKYEIYHKTIGRNYYCINEKYLGLGLGSMFTEKDRQIQDDTISEHLERGIELCCYDPTESNFSINAMLGTKEKSLKTMAFLIKKYPHIQKQLALKYGLLDYSELIQTIEDKITETQKFKEIISETPIFGSELGVRVLKSLGLRRNTTTINKNNTFPSNTLEELHTLYCKNSNNSFIGCEVALSSDEGPIDIERINTYIKEEQKARTEEKESSDYYFSEDDPSLIGIPEEIAKIQIGVVYYIKFKGCKVIKTNLSVAATGTLSKDLILEELLIDQGGQYLLLKNFSFSSSEIAHSFDRVISDRKYNFKNPSEVFRDIQTESPEILGTKRLNSKNKPVTR